MSPQQPTRLGWSPSIALICGLEDGMTLPHPLKETQENFESFLDSKALPQNEPGCDSGGSPEGGGMKCCCDTVISAGGAAAAFSQELLSLCATQSGAGAIPVVQAVLIYI